MCNGKRCGLMNKIFLKEKKGWTIFYRWMMKDLRSQSEILLENKVIVSVLYKSENSGIIDH